MSRFPLQRIQDFIKNMNPFDTLDENELDVLVRAMEVAYFPRDTAIIEAGGEPADHLFIIHSGSVKVWVPSPSGDEILVDIRGEGDVFGAVSVLSSKEALFSVTAREDLLTFLLPAREFRQLVEKKEGFRRHFTFSLARNLESARNFPQTGTSRTTAGIDDIRDVTVQMRNRVSTLMSTNVLRCSPETSVREAARQMTARGVGSIVVTEKSDLPLGVITDTDFRARVLAQGEDPALQVSKVMSRPPLTISYNAFAFEAMLDMTRHGVHHLLVTEGDRMVGIISDHDIKVVLGSSPVGLAREIDNVTSLSELEKLPQKFHRLLEMLLRLGSSPEYMMDLFSEVIDRLSLKLFKVIGQQMQDSGLGAVPADYCWLALDGSGRREQAPLNRQSNALVFSDVPPEREGVVKEWFLGFGRRINEALAVCGKAYCSFGMLAREPGWCRSAGQWQHAAAEWITGSEIENLRQIKGFFDFRPIMGEAAFAVGLKKKIWEDIEKSPAFLRNLLLASIGNMPPLGFLRQCVVGRDGETVEAFNLADLLAPVIGGARVMALHHRIGETGTLGRLSELGLIGVLPENLVADLRESFSLVTKLRISRFLETEKAGTVDYDTVSPGELDHRQKKMLKESFAVIADFRERVTARYAR